MQKIYFEKLVNLNHQLNELISISVDESINYKIEELGMRAQGSIDITGEFLKRTNKERFNETLEIDLLAPFEKVIDQRDFNIKVEDFDYKILDGDLLVTIQASVYGVVASEDKRIEDINLRCNDDVDLDLIEEIKEVIKSNEEKIDEKEIQIESIEEIKREELDEKTIEDLIETSNQHDLVPYYIYVSSASDTYETISSYYSVPSAIIQEYNRDKTIEAGSLIVIPYYEQ